MPLSVEEYRVAQMYMVTKMQKQHTSGDEGVEVLVNEPFENDEFGKGQYTSKVYHLQSKAPTWLSAIAPTNSLLIEEEAWNAYPKCKTVLKCPYFNRFKLTIETIHAPDNGHSSNVHNLPAGLLKTRKVEMVDISSNVSDYWSYMIGGEEINLQSFHSEKTKRGPLTPDWQESCEPVMTAYKLVTVDAPYWGFGYRLEQLLLGEDFVTLLDAAPKANGTQQFLMSGLFTLQGERALFMASHKQCFAWIDEWIGLSFDDVRQLELMMDKALKETMSQHGSVQTTGSTSMKEANLGGLTSITEVGQSTVLGSLPADDRQPQTDKQKSYPQGKLGGESRVDGNLSSTVALMI